MHLGHKRLWQLESPLGQVPVRAGYLCGEFWSAFQSRLSAR